MRHEFIKPLAPYPCKQDCPDRSAECHATCKAYLEAVAINSAKREEIIKMANKAKVVTEYSINRGRKIAKERNRRKRK